MNNTLLITMLCLCSVIAGAKDKEAKYKSKVSISYVNIHLAEHASIEKLSGSKYHYHFQKTTPDNAIYSVHFKSKVKDLVVDYFSSHLRDSTVVLDGQYSKCKGKVVLEHGSYKEGKCDGEWVQNSNEGVLKSKAWYTTKDGDHYAYKEFFLPDGKLQRSAHFINKVLQGEEKLYAPNGDLLQTLNNTDGEPDKALNIGCSVDGDFHGRMIENYRDMVRNAGVKVNSNRTLKLKFLVDKDGLIANARVVKKHPETKRLEKDIEKMGLYIPSPGIVTLEGEAVPYLLETALPLKGLKVKATPNTKSEFSIQRDWDYSPQYGWISLITLKSQAQKKAKAKRKTVTVKPVFPGGAAGLRSYIAKTVKYPVTAQKNREQGKVFVAFTISTNGTVANVHVVKSVSRSLDAEASRVVTNMPHWQPGEDANGELVEVEYVVPIGFKLN